MLALLPGNTLKVSEKSCYPRLPELFGQIEKGEQIFIWDFSIYYSNDRFVKELSVKFPEDVKCFEYFNFVKTYTDANMHSKDN